MDQYFITLINSYFQHDSRNKRIQKWLKERTNMIITGTKVLRFSNTCHNINEHYHTAYVCWGVGSN